MTNIKWVSAALIMFSTVVCQAQSKFEGVVKYNTTNTAVNEIATVAWYLKNGQSRLEFDTHGRSDIWAWIASTIVRSAIQTRSASAS